MISSRVILFLAIILTSTLQSMSYTKELEDKGFDFIARKKNLAYDIGENDKQNILSTAGTKQVLRYLDDLDENADAYFKPVKRNPTIDDDLIDKSLRKYECRKGKIRCKNACKKALRNLCNSTENCDTTILSEIVWRCSSYCQQNFNDSDSE